MKYINYLEGQISDEASGKIKKIKKQPWGRREGLKLCLDFASIYWVSCADNFISPYVILC